MRVKPLRGIGYWRSEREPELPDPRDFVDPTWDEHDRNVVASYLLEGFVAHAFMGYSPCRLCDKGDNGDLDRTDGTYVWPSGLAHYLTEHGVRLPDEFVSHVWGMIDLNEATSRDLEWWLEQRPHP
jgi:hypothetical protein